ncbi:hypothetical protein S83_043850, partial [Arachis hypogaea]
TVTVGGGVVIAALPATSLLLQLVFKQTEEKEDFVGFLCAYELENSVSVADESQESRKRKNSFEGGIQSQTVRNNVVVLEGESKFKQKGQKAQIEINSSNKKPKPLYNHCMIFTSAC